MVNTNSCSRLQGLDLARFLAFVGMVVVNFKIVMGAEDDGGVLGVLAGSLEGKAAATFVVLAGVGLGLAASRSSHSQTVLVTMKRAAFLLALGLVNSLIFDADIIHYYAFYFLFGVLALPFRTRTLVAAIVSLNLAFLVLLVVLDYDVGWNWGDYSYVGFWTPSGFIRNLFFNGWHPVIPWLAFLLFGILLSRAGLANTTTQNRLILYGAITLVFAEAVSELLSRSLTVIDPELAIIATTAPIPPMPLYVVAGSGAAAAVIGLCLRYAWWFDKVGIIRIVTPAGRQTLTLYIAHILVGMGALEALGMLGGQSLRSSVLAALVFCGLSIIYALLWSRTFKRGPIEGAMRRIAG
ncbi:MAG: DUF418 domain-containing protein [Woeseiaceae bacterium]